MAADTASIKDKRIKTIVNVRAIIGSCVVGLMVLGAGVQAFAQVVADDPVGLDPVLDPLEHRTDFDARTKGLWVQALGRKDAETRSRAAEAIAKAVPLGMPGLAETGPKLSAMLDERDQPLEVRLAVLHALVALKTPGTAPQLLAHGKSDGLVAMLLTDTALAERNEPTARPVWRARLTDAAVSGQALASAVWCLGVVQDADAGPALLVLALDGKRDAALRIAAAQALAVIGPKGLDSAAAELVKSPPGIDHLVAVSLLVCGRTDLARATLSQLAADDDAVVVARAVAAMVAMDPNSLKDIQGNLLKHADADVRRNTVQGLAGQKTEDAVELLGRRLSDESFKVRSAAADGLVTLDREVALRAKVRAVARAALGDSNSHAVEQGANVLGAVRETEAADALLGLLGSTHSEAGDSEAGKSEVRKSEVRLAAVVALRRLAVPKTCPALLEYARKLSAEWTAMPATMPDTTQQRIDKKMDQQLVELLEAIGVMRYEPATPLLMEFVPKQATFGRDARVAAVWALGKIYANRAPSTPGNLAGALSSRLNDNDPMHPEYTFVRCAAAIALGHMKNPAFVGTLRAAYSSPPVLVEIQQACRWAIGEITGQPQKPLAPVINMPPASFLEPYDSMP